MKRYLLFFAAFGFLLTFLSGCYTLTRPPISAIEVDSTTAITYYHKEYYDNRIENYHFYDPYGYYSYSPYRWHLRFDWFTGSYYYDPYFYDYRYYGSDWYYYNNRYYWYHNGYWYYVPSPGSGSSGDDESNIPDKRTLTVPRAIGPSSPPPSNSPFTPTNDSRYSSGNATPLNTPPPTSSPSSEVKSYSTPKSTNGGNTSSDTSTETKSQNSNSNRRTTNPKR
ncbi:MAG: hypothetical protein PHE86_00590 [Candidatus Marinimicrobia bacterium]|nr:hypothetical protein [Candidatus Neomarinimicrobiota bacterium]MDD5582246.1 hypothetical protein [Candidatus Neomarinimicrobiota bacterium]